MWEPLAIEPCYYVPVTSVISGAIVGSTAQYMWHLYRTIRVEAEHQVFEHCIIKVWSFHCRCEWSTRCVYHTSQPFLSRKHCGPPNVSCSPTEEKVIWCLLVSVMLCWWYAPVQAKFSYKRSYLCLISKSNVSLNSRQLTVNHFRRLFIDKNLMLKRT